MPKGTFKTVVLTDDLDEVLRFLVDVVRVEPVLAFESSGEQAAAGLGWPPEHGATRGAIVGAGPGLIELVEIPPPLRATVQPGVVLLSFAIPDVEEVAEEARSQGFEVRGPNVVIGVDGEPHTMAPVPVGGVPFELIRFGRRR